MKNLSDWLVGRTVVAIDSVEDYLQLKMDDGGVLNIYNPSKISREKETFYSRSIQEVVLNDLEVVLQFGSDDSIRISLRPEDYASPEAFSYCSKTDEWIVG